MCSGALPMTPLPSLQAVKQDACRSLVSRVQAMVESKAMSEQLPVRVALSASPWHCDITEYSLPHEDIQVCGWVSRNHDMVQPGVKIHLPKGENSLQY